MQSKIEKFFLDVNANDEVFETLSHQIKIHKEQYDDRFQIIYAKRNYETIKQDTYSVAGYYDIKDHCLYEPDRVMIEKLPEDGEISIKKFEDISSKFLADLRKYVVDYCFKNEDKLKQIAKAKYEAKDDYRIGNYKGDVRRLFLTEANPQIKLTILTSDYELTKEDDYLNDVISYLKNPEKELEQFSEKLIQKNGEDFGLELYLYHDKQNYLKEILENKNNEFKDLYINKNILDSIKYNDASNVNITINYSGKEMTFKFDYRELKNELSSGNLACLRSYYNGYYDVKDFLQDNANSSEYNSTDKNGFLFSHITSITYGKKELYHNDLQKDDKQVEIEEDYELEK